jgi:hypothetical protein
MDCSGFTGAGYKSAGHTLSMGEKPPAIREGVASGLWHQPHHQLVQDMVVDTCLDSELGNLVRIDIRVEHMFEAVHILVVVLVVEIGHQQPLGRLQDILVRDTVVEVVGCTWTQQRGHWSHIAVRHMPVVLFRGRQLAVAAVAAADLVAPVMDPVRWDNCIPYFGQPPEISSFWKNFDFGFSMEKRLLWCKGYGFNWVKVQRGQTWANHRVTDLFFALLFRRPLLGWYVEDLGAREYCI